MLGRTNNPAYALCINGSLCQTSNIGLKEFTTIGRRTTKDGQSNEREIELRHDPRQTAVRTVSENNKRHVVFHTMIWRLSCLVSWFGVYQVMLPGRRASYNDTRYSVCQMTVRGTVSVMRWHAQDGSQMMVRGKLLVVRWHVLARKCHKWWYAATCMTYDGKLNSVWHKIKSDEACFIWCQV